MSRRKKFATLDEGQQQITSFFVKGAQDLEQQVSKPPSPQYSSRSPASLAECQDLEQQESRQHHQHCPRRCRSAAHLMLVHHRLN
ncbi:hypothetical protein TYRP_000936 [Tyrophagus putrescentiae]|nr:hypothetical protein TYRP_000936 [Tyrophagus putrescentiae]